MSGASFLYPLFLYPLLTGFFLGLTLAALVAASRLPERSPEVPRD